MAVETVGQHHSGRSLVSYLYQPKVRSVIYQVALLAGLIFVGYEIVSNLF